MQHILTATGTNDTFYLTIEDTATNTMQIDLPVEQGGTGKGMRPMQTLLAALAGCSNVDVVSILKKQKQNFDTLTISISGEREKDKELAVWENIHLTFTFTGNIELTKAERAVQLSIDKYCSVAETLRRAGATISYEVEVH